MTVKFVPVNSPEVILNSEHCLQGLNLLGHAQLIDLFIGSECGGQGRCGKDRVQIRPEEQIHFNPPNGVERRHLSENEIAEGWRLACQCFPSQDGLELTIGLSNPERPD